ncbi:DUF1835 domain-containing protein [Clostridium sp. BJN0001]|uniref:DUF1835 domain-containing protein n=1 Tax=Clostridium sp. BJN0001 TaxID=2930219 RepID=UPI001FD5E09A|nr:DUF1835 domain-containing protein [Clostridium sp. BJN0001]
MNRIIHICFSESARGSLKYAINQKIIEGEKVISFFDDISQGPIFCSIDKRLDWLKNTLSKDEYYYENINDIKENYIEFQEEIAKLDDTNSIYFWYGQNAIEICGLMYALEILKDKWKNVYLINVSDMPMKVNCGLYIPRSVGEIMPEKFSEYIKVNKKITKDKYIELLAQWNMLKKEKSNLRIFKDEKVKNISEDYFDILILKYTPKEFKKSSRTIGDVLGNSEILISDSYIFWRVKELIKSQKINYRGNFNVMRYCEISISNKGLDYLKKNNIK